MSATKGIVLTGPDAAIEGKAKSGKLEVVVDPERPLAYDKTMFVEPGTRVPWDLLPAAWHFLERWDAAVPLWRYGVTAADVGMPEERKRTQADVRDLRVLLHAVELLFVRDNEDGRALMDAYRAELADADGNPCEKRLAFLRAMYRAKPRVCVLPRSWVAEVAERSAQDSRTAMSLRKRKTPLVAVEIGPGHYVQCHIGDEEKVRAMFAARRGRHGR